MQFGKLVRLVASCSLLAVVILTRSFLGNTPFCTALSIVDPAGANCLPSPPSPGNARAVSLIDERTRVRCCDNCLRFRSASFFAAYDSASKCSNTCPGVSQRPFYVNGASSASQCGVWDGPCSVKATSHLKPMSQVSRFAQE